MEPVADPGVFFHMHQEIFAVSADDGAKHPLAFPNASACQICCVGFTISHVSSYPSTVPGSARASQQGNVA